MVDQMVVISVPQLEAIIKSTISTELATLFQTQEKTYEEKPVVYRTREYVKNLLHTSYPTIIKYSKAGLLKPVYFGRKVLYREDELNLALPKIQTLLNNNRRKKAA